MEEKDHELKTLETVKDSLEISLTSYIYPKINILQSKR